MLAQMLLLQNDIKKFLLLSNFRFPDGTSGHIEDIDGVLFYLS